VAIASSDNGDTGSGISNGLDIEKQHQRQISRMFTVQELN